MYFFLILGSGHAYLCVSAAGNTSTAAAGQMVGNRGFVRPMPVSDEAYERAVSHLAADPKHAWGFVITPRGGGEVRL